jgi:hypothetical protein
MAHTEIRRARGNAHEVDSPAINPGEPNHDEWVLDEALEETFPASDPPVPVRPGSTLALRYSGRAARRSRAIELTFRIVLVVTGAIVLASFARRSLTRGVTRARGTRRPTRGRIAF